MKIFICRLSARAFSEPSLLKALERGVVNRELIAQTVISHVIRIELEIIPIAKIKAASVGNRRTFK